MTGNGIDLRTDGAEPQGNTQPRNIERTDRVQRQKHRHRPSLGRLGAVLLGGTMLTVFFSFGGSDTAHAVCTGGAAGYTGTNAIDIVNCDGTVPTGGGSVVTLGEDDEITITGGSYVGVTPGEGDDTVTVTGGTITAILDETGIAGGEDIFDLSGGTITVVSGADNDDTYNISGTVVLGGIDESGRTGNDTVIMSGGTVNETINTGIGADMITLTGGTVGDGGSGNGDVVAGDGADTILLNGSSVLDDIAGGDGDDKIDIVSGSVDDVFGDTSTGGSGIDTITLTGGLVNDDVRGGGANDIITLNGTTVMDDIRGSAGEDTISLLSGTVAEVYGDNNVNGEGENDIITLNGATVTGFGIFGDAGEDTITLLSGTVVDVRGDDDDDMITLNGATVLDDILGGGDNDTIDLISGSAETAFGDSGNDTITLAGATLGNLVGNTGDDDIIWSSGTLLGNIVGDNNTSNGESGSDTATITNPDAVLANRRIEGDSLNSGGNVSYADGVIDTLRLNGWSGELTGATITNWEIMRIAGGTATFIDGALTVGIDDAMAGLFVDATGAAAFTMDFDLNGNLTNSGAIILTADGAVAGTDLRVFGDYTGDDGSLLVDVYLDDGTSQLTDKLLVDEGTSGSTLVFVDNDDGPGGITGQGPTDGIKIVEVGGDSLGTFALGAPAIGGAFEYGLFQADGQNWYLQTTNLSDPAIIDPVLPYSLRSFGRELVGTYYERTGARIGWRPDGPSSNAGGAGADLSVAQPDYETYPDEPSSIYGTWVRLIGAWSEADGSLLDDFDGVSYDESLWALQGGFDAIVSESDDGALTASAFLNYGQIATDATNRTTGLAAGSADTDAWGGGAALTFTNESGLYVDGLASYTRYDLDISTAAGATGSTNGDGWAFSGEAGWRLPLGSGFAVTPQAQLVYQLIDIDDFVDSDGTTATVSNADSLEGRFGAAFEYTPYSTGSKTRFYAEANILHEFLDDPVTVVDGTPLSIAFEDSSYQVGAGLEWGQIGGGVAAWAEGGYRAPLTGGDGAETWSAKGGLAVRY